MLPFAPAVSVRTAIEAVVVCALTGALLVQGWRLNAARDEARTLGAQVSQLQAAITAQNAGIEVLRADTARRDQAAAAAAIRSTFRAVVRDDLDINFEEIARSNTDIYEKVCRYFDELISKVVWASTLTTDAGSNGTYALGKVHAEGKYDVIRSYAHQWAASLQVLVNAYVVWNYGPDAPLPQVVVDVEEAEDLVAKSQVVKNLADAGVPLVASEIREQFGFREPQEGDELIGGAAAAPEAAPAAGQAPPGAAQNTRRGVGCPVHSANAVAARDAIDDLADSMLADWEVVSADIDAQLAAAAANTSDIATMRSAVVAAVESLDVEALAVLLARSRTKTRLAGDTGANV